MRKKHIAKKALNPVAIHAPKFNKFMVHKDKKKESKKGFQKHKKGLGDKYSSEAFSFFCLKNIKSALKITNF